MADAPLVMDTKPLSLRRSSAAIELRKRQEQTSAEAVKAIEGGQTLLAGALAGLISETLLHPLDTLSLRAKVHPLGVYGTLAGSFRLILQQG